MNLEFSPLFISHREASPGQWLQFSISHSTRMQIYYTHTQFLISKRTPCSQHTYILHDFFPSSPMFFFHTKHMPLRYVSWHTHIHTWHKLSKLCSFEHCILVSILWVYHHDFILIFPIFTFYIFFNSLCNENLAIFQD